MFIFLFYFTSFNPDRPEKAVFFFLFPMWAEWTSKSILRCPAAYMNLPEVFTFQRVDLTHTHTVFLEVSIFKSVSKYRWWIKWEKFTSLETKEHWKKQNICCTIKFSSSWHDRKWPMGRKGGGKRSRIHLSWRKMKYVQHTVRSGLVSYLHG